MIANNVESPSDTTLFTSSYQTMHKALQYRSLMLDLRRLYFENGALAEAMKGVSIDKYLNYLLGEAREAMLLFASMDRIDPKPVSIPQVRSPKVNYPKVEQTPYHPRGTKFLPTTLFAMVVQVQLLKFANILKRSQNKNILGFFNSCEKAQFDFDKNPATLKKFACRMLLRTLSSLAVCGNPLNSLTAAAPPTIPVDELKEYLPVVLSNKKIICEISHDIDHFKKMCKNPEKPTLHIRPLISEISFLFEKRKRSALLRWRHQSYGSPKISHPIIESCISADRPDSQSTVDVRIDLETGLTKITSILRVSNK